MTKDEKTYYIETLEQIRFRSEERGWGGEVEALDIAIELLEKQPCDEEVKADSKGTVAENETLDDDEMFGDYMSPIV